METMDNRGGALRRGRLAESQLDPAEDEVAMDAACWGSLPRELLPLVFARLPLPLLLSLRRVALEENWIIDLAGDEFTLSCAQRWDPNTLCGIVLKEPNSATYDVGVVHSGEWITLSWHKLRLDRREPVNTLCPGDGGLVCFCLTFGEEGDDLLLVLTVANPLTGVGRALPNDHGVSPFNLRMMQLMVDESTKQYQVLLVHNEASNDGNSVPEKEPASSSAASGGASQSGEESEEEFEEELSEEELSEEESEHIIEQYPPLEGVIFDSSTGVWRNARCSSQVFVGPTLHEERYVRVPVQGWTVSRDDASSYKMDFQGSSRFFGPTAYNCTSGEVLSLRNPWLDESADSRDFTLIKDRLFMLELIWQGDMGSKFGEYSLSEHQVQVRREKLTWRSVVTWDVLPAEAHGKVDGGGWGDTDLQVVACDGFVLVRGSHWSMCRMFPVPLSHVAILCDLATGERIDLQKGGSDEPGAATTEPEEGEDVVEDEELRRSRVMCRRKLRVCGDDPSKIGSSPIMLCNLDWEPVP